MKNQPDWSKKIEKVISDTPISRSKEPELISIIGQHAGKIIYIGILAGIGLFMNSCMTGYVATEPRYTEYSRPQRPSDHHIWINGDWVYNRSTQVYVQKNGYWAKPQQNRIYISGQWQSTPRGKYWNRGHWQKQNSKSKHDNRRR